MSAKWGAAAMVSASSVNSIAVLLLGQVRPVSAADRGVAGGDLLVAAANCVSAPRLSVDSPTSKQAQARVSDALLSASAPDVNQLKINLMQRLGKEFGLSMDDFDDQASFGAAIRDAVGQLRLQEGGDRVLAAIEKKLGLDKLGVPLDTLVNAIIDPEGADAEKLGAALERQAVKEAEEKEADAAQGVPARIRTDDLGLYAP